MYRLIFILLVFLPPRFQPHRFIFQKKLFSRYGYTLPYRILYPPYYNENKSYPVLTLLHGSGERGTDNRAQLLRGGSLFERDDVRKRFPAIVIFPQCPEDSVWSYFTSTPDNSNITGRTISFRFSAHPPSSALLVKLLLDSLVAAKKADPDRMYIGGLSLGGFGAFDMIERYPGYFAAAFPVCGGGDTSTADRFARKVSVWMFHGAVDKVVDVSYSRQYYNVLKRLGADVRYTEYPRVGHNSWDWVFEEKDLLPWVFSKSRRIQVNP
ncbi:MAG: phospholipase [Williamsia sp.]|nr:phospholipase [Williamsia sp.]